MIRTASIGLTGLVLAACLGLAPPPAFAQAPLAPGQAPPQFQAVDADRIVATMQVDLLADVLAAEIAASGDPFRPDTPPHAGPDDGWDVIVERVAPQPSSGPTCGGVSGRKGSPEAAISAAST